MAKFSQDQEGKDAVVRQPDELLYTCVLQVG